MIVPMTSARIVDRIAAIRIGRPPYRNRVHTSWPTLAEPNVDGRRVFAAGWNGLAMPFCSPYGAT